MAYISLYRKYRPDTFDKVIGQDHIVKTLINQLKNHTVSHAYLFTGTRGTGKTTVARILSKAVNCLNPVGGSPCGKCGNCLELSRLNSVDITEIDAASNNSVDDIRELCDKTVYSPASVKYKVIIIDEVHMLSGSAFNALLKTLEEPPSHVIFILATTDVHKLPQTILSRCLRFDFKLVNADLLAANIKNIFADMGVTYEEEAVRLIAVAAEGSVRDSLSIADKCIAYDNHVTYDKVLEILGASNPHQIVALIKNIADGDIGSALLSINKLASLGKNMAMIAKDSAVVLSNMLYIKNCKATDLQLGIPKPVYDELLPLLQQISNSRILFVLDLLNGVAGELKYTTQPRILLEAALVRAITETDNSAGGMQQRIKELEAKVSALSAEKKTPSTEGKIIAEQKAIKAEEEQPQLKIAVTETQKTVEVTIKETPAVVKTEIVSGYTDEELWKKLLLTLIERKYGLLHGALKKIAKPEIAGNIIRLPITDYNSRNVFNNPSNRKLIVDVLKELSGKNYNVGVYEVEEPVNVSDTETEDKLKAIFGDRLKILK